MRQIRILKSEKNVRYVRRRLKQINEQQSPGNKQFEGKNKYKNIFWISTEKEDILKFVRIG